MYITIVCKTLPSNLLKKLKVLIKKHLKQEKLPQKIIQLSDSSLVEEMPNYEEKKQIQLTQKLKYLLSLFFKKYGILDVNITNIPYFEQYKFPSFITTFPLSGHKDQHMLNSKSKNIIFDIADKECIFDIANNIEPFYLKYNYDNPDIESLYPYQDINHYLFNINDLDILNGFNRLNKLKEFISNIKSENIIINQGCIAQICGLDLTNTIKNNNTNAVFITDSYSRREIVTFPNNKDMPYKKIKNSIVIINANNNLFQKELILIFKKLNYENYMFLFPHYSPQDTEILKRYETAIIFTTDNSKFIVENIKDKHFKKVIFQFDCYGVNQTNKLIRNLILLKNSKIKQEDIMKELFNKQLKRYEIIKEKIKNRRINVIISFEESAIVFANYHKYLKYKILRTIYSKDFNSTLADFPLETSSKLRALYEDLNINYDFYIFSSNKLDKTFKNDISDMLNKLYPNSNIKIFTDYKNLFNDLIKSKNILTISNYSLDERILNCRKLPISLSFIKQGISKTIENYELIYNKMESKIFKEYDYYK
jgi:hypothetical protein